MTSPEVKAEGIPPPKLGLPHRPPTRCGDRWSPLLDLNMSTTLYIQACFPPQPLMSDEHRARDEDLGEAFAASSQEPSKVRIEMRSPVGFWPNLSDHKTLAAPIKDSMYRRSSSGSVGCSNDFTPNTIGFGEPLSRSPSILCRLHKRRNDRTVFSPEPIH